MRENNLILAADDFGISQKANDNILELIRLKKLSRVAIMTDGLINRDEIDRLLVSDVKLDIHLKLAKLNPENNERKFKKGVLGRSFSFLFLYFTGKVGAASAEIAWEKQITQFEELFGKKPNGANSHQHIHFFPAYLKVILRLCKKHNIAYLRFGRKYQTKYCNLICFILNLLRIKGLGMFLKSDLQTSDLVVSLDWIGNIKKFLRKINLESTELVCHPERDAEFEIIKKYF
jgi:predicted glycoside hydrolase/deacetylase ChbG (UPF0249 family)